MKRLISSRCRRRLKVIRHAKEIEDWIDRMDQAAPCANPECNQFRQDIRQIVDNIRRQS